MREFLICYLWNPFCRLAAWLLIGYEQDIERAHEKVSRRVMWYLLMIISIVIGGEIGFMGAEWSRNLNLFLVVSLLFFSTLSYSFLLYSERLLTWVA